MNLWGCPSARCLSCLLRSEGIAGWSEASDEGLRGPIYFLDLIPIEHRVFARPFRKPWVVLWDAKEKIDVTARRIREFDRSEFFGDLLKESMPRFRVSTKTGDVWRKQSIDG
jgi:hypothetical protein